MVKVIDQKKQWETWLADYRDYLANVIGVAPATQRSYLHVTRRFLNSIDECQLHSLSPKVVADFVQRDAAPRTGQGPNTTAVAIRSFLRFLVTQRVVADGFSAVVPAMRCYKHASLPVQLTDGEIARILAQCDIETDHGIRDFALVLLLSRLGLRLDEASRLTLEDIDWRRGNALIRSTKNRTERRIPLPEDVGQAVLRYLRQSRPAGTARNIFLQTKSPFKPYESGALGKIVKRLMARCELSSRSAHAFRHTAATKMVNQGIHFKEIADVLGHQSLRSTTIYAKLDLVSLAKIALPWPEDALS